MVISYLCPLAPVPSSGILHHRNVSRRVRILEENANLSEFWQLASRFDRFENGRVPRRIQAKQSFALLKRISVYGTKLEILEN